MKAASLRHISGRLRDPNAPLRPGMKMPDQGAATQVYVVSRPDLQGVRGDYFEDGNRVRRVVPIGGMWLWQIVCRPYRRR